MAKTEQPQEPQQPEETALAQTGLNAFLGIMGAGQQHPVEIVRDADGRAVGVDIESENLEVPRLALVQKQSRVTDENIAKPGDILSTLMMEVLWPKEQHRLTTPPSPQTATFLVPGLEPPTLALPFLPLKAFVDRVMFNESFELVCRSIPGGRVAQQGFRSPAWQEGDLWDARVCENCPCKDWGDNGEKPACSFTYNVVGFALNTSATDNEEILGTPLAVTFSNTSVKTGKQIATAMKATGKNPWSYIWLLWASRESKNNNVYYVWRAKMAQEPGKAKYLATPAPLAELAAMIYLNLTDRTLEVDHTTAASAAEEMIEGSLADSPDEDVWDEPKQ